MRAKHHNKSDRQASEPDPQRRIAKAAITLLLGDDPFWFFGVAHEALLSVLGTVRNRVVSGRPAFGLVCSRSGHTREGRIGLQRPRKPLKRKGPFSVEFTPKSAEVCGCRQLGKLMI